MRYLILSNILLVVVSISGCVSLEQSDYKKAEGKNTIDAYHDFLKKHPEGDFAEKARLNRVVLVFEASKKKDTVDGYVTFLEEHSSFLSKTVRADIIKQCQIRIGEIFEGVKEENTLESYQEFLNSKPPDDLAKEAKKRIEKLHEEELLAFTQARQERTLHEYRRFLQDYPKSKFREEIEPEIEALEIEAASRRKKEALEEEVQKYFNFKTNIGKIRVVQDTLKQLGYKAGFISGEVGEETTQAILAFQKNTKIPTDGKVSDSLMTELRSAIRERLRENFSKRDKNTSQPCKVIWTQHLKQTPNTISNWNISKNECPSKYDDEIKKFAVEALRVKPGLFGTMKFSIQPKGGEPFIKKPLSQPDGKNIGVRVRGEMSCEGILLKRGGTLKKIREYYVIDGATWHLESSNCPPEYDESIFHGPDLSLIGPGQMVEVHSITVQFSP